MPDFRFAGRTLRIFWRGFTCPQRPYGWRDYGIIAFGAGPVGVMYWPPQGADR